MQNRNARPGFIRGILADFGTAILLITIFVGTLTIFENLPQITQLLIDATAIRD